MNKNIFLIGTGQMAIDYSKVLKAQEISFKVIGRGEDSAAKFKAATDIVPVTGGIKNYLEMNPFPENSYVIIATGMQDLMQTMLIVLKAGATKVLVEKPAALSIEELLRNEPNLKPYFRKVFVAYNRRFYASVLETQKLINEDGGLQSMIFEFTEWAHRIESIQKAPGVKENWFFANSTHVIDLAFFIAGSPVKWQAYSKSGKLSWHAKINFAGAGITDKGVLFSYISNWDSAGRWGIELLTNNRRIYLKPLEGIGIQMKGTIQIVDHLFDDSLDKKFKPGLYKEIEDFIQYTPIRLPSIDEQIKNAQLYYAKILE